MTEKVEKVLMEFYEGEISRRDIIEKLENAEPYDLYMAELELMNAGLQKKDLAEISEIYLDLIESETDDKFFKLDDDHPVRRFVIEHEKIKSMLLVLEGSIMRDELEANRKKFENIFENLNEFKRHIKREERTLFDRLRKEESPGRILLLSEEHDDFIKILERIRDLSEDWGNNIEKIKDGAKEMIYTLRMHHFIEDDLFYPVVLDLLDDWDEIKEENDRIGYCEFKPV